MTPRSACVQAGHDSAYITLELRQPEHWNLKEAPSHRHLLVFSTSCGSMKFLTIQFWFHEVSEPNVGNITVSGATKVTCCVDAVHKPCQPDTNTHMNKHPHRGGLWLDYDWQVSEVLAGMMLLTITPYFKVACLSERHPTHCWLTRISHICRPVVAQVTARLSHRIWVCCSEF